MLVRKESPFAWYTVLEDFPAPPYAKELLPTLAFVLNDQLADVSPKVLPGAHGRLTWNWHCNTLLQAMYLMLLLDLSGGSQLRECASHDRVTYSRVGSQGKTLYCSEKHANRASTRLQSGQVP